MTFTKWRTLVALIPLILAIVMEWWWFFAVLFAIQVLFSLLSGTVEYVEEVRRDEHPFLYWFVISIWIFLAIYSLVS